jgi:hydrogenase maturation factor
VSPAPAETAPAETPCAVPAETACAAPAGHCITCGDEAVAMEVVRETGSLAICRDDESQLHEVAIDLVEPVGTGDGVLVHAGVAIRRLEAGA